MLKRACSQAVLIWGCLGPSGNFSGFTGALAYLRYDCSCSVFSYCSFEHCFHFLGFCLPPFLNPPLPLQFAAHTCLLSPIRSPSVFLKLTIQASQQEVSSKGKVFLHKAVVPGVVSC